jgi:Co/Zn/Cd efflux system component
LACQSVPLLSRAEQRTTSCGTACLLVNLTCALVLARHRKHRGTLTKVAFLSARNDALANLAIIAAGSVTAYSRSAWPHVAVGLGIGAMNASTALEAWRAPHKERLMAEP